MGGQAGTPSCKDANVRTIAVISQKGGTGKSTIAIHLAVAAHLAGHRCAVVDLDPQASARKWGDKREADGPEVVGEAPCRTAQRHAFGPLPSREALDAEAA